MPNKPALLRVFDIHDVFTFTIEAVHTHCFTNTERIPKQSLEKATARCRHYRRPGRCFSLSSMGNTRAEVAAHWQTRGKGAVVSLFLSTYTPPVFYCGFWKNNIQERSTPSNLFLLTYHMVSLQNRMFDLYPPSLCKTHSQKHREVFYAQNEARKPEEYCTWK